jgi:hypothetical protein
VPMCSVHAKASKAVATRVVQRVTRENASVAVAER